MSDIGDILPFVSLPLFLLGPKGAAVYFAINMAGCATAEDSPPQTNRDDAGVEYDSIDADFVEDDSPDDRGVDADTDFETGADADISDAYAEDRTPGECEGIGDEFVFTPHDCYTGPAGAAGVGECRLGTKICIFDSDTNDWKWSGCEGEIFPRDEICDNLDNDCDYSTDEDTAEDCGGCACLEGACEEPVCVGESSCGDDDGCGDICQSCPPGEICTGDSYCAPLPLDCIVTDSFDFGTNFITHGYVSSAGVHPGISPGDSCGAALGVYFDRVGDWVQVSLAVDPASDVVKLDSFSNTGGVTIQADGFDCHEISCWTGNMCRRDSLTWHMHELSYNIASDGAVDFVFRAGSVVVGRTDIAIVETLSCSYVHP